MIVISQAVIGLGCGHIAREVEDSRRIVRLPEVIKEDALLAPNLDRMPSLYPLQSGRVTVKRVGKVRIHAALIKQR